MKTKCVIFFREELFKDDINPPEPEPLDYKSVTAKDFNIDSFRHVPPKPTKVSAINSKCFLKHRKPYNNVAGIFFKINVYFLHEEFAVIKFQSYFNRRPLYHI